MSKNPSKHRHEPGLGHHDDYLKDSFNDDDFARDIYSTEWGDEYADEDQVSARRRIERRREEEQLRSELRDWEKFGLRDDDY